MHGAPGPSDTTLSKRYASAIGVIFSCGKTPDSAQQRYVRRQRAAIVGDAHLVKQRADAISEVSQLS